MKGVRPGVAVERGTEPGLFHPFWSIPAASSYSAGHSLRAHGNSQRTGFHAARSEVSGPTCAAFAQKLMPDDLSKGSGSGRTHRPCDRFRVFCMGIKLPISGGSSVTRGPCLGRSPGNGGGAVVMTGGGGDGDAAGEKADGGGALPPALS